MESLDVNAWLQCIDRQSTDAKNKAIGGVNIEEYREHLAHPASQRQN